MLKLCETRKYKQFRQVNATKLVTICLLTSLAKYASCQYSSDGVSNRITVIRKGIQPFE